MMRTMLNVEGLIKGFGGAPVVNGVDFSLEPGQIGCLLGPSGCGKTTALRCIAGLETPDAGTIVVDGRTAFGSGVDTPARNRRIGMVFQDYALFAHMSVRQNIAFGIAHLSPAERTRRVDVLLESLGIVHRADARPHQLSGGEQQRVALARALAPEPAVVLMDEPFSNLDASLKERLSKNLRTHLKAIGATALVVTHDQQEAFAMADVIGVMQGGHLHQLADAHTMYHRPANPFVADFLGYGSFIDGTVEEDSVLTGMGRLTGEFSLPCDNGCPVSVLVRPDDVVFDPESDLAPVVRDRLFRGPTILYTLGLPSGESIVALVPSHVNVQPGECLPIRADVADIVLFPRRCELDIDCEHAIHT